MDLIKSIILEKYKDHEFKFEKSEIIIDNRYTITILEDNKCCDIEKHINKKINKCDDECEICFNKIINNFICPKCINNYCYDCYIDLFKRNKGVIICPFCRYKSGKKIYDDDIINEFIEKIKAKADTENTIKF